MSRARRSPELWRVVAALAACGSAGCAKSCKNDHPYVPYTIETSASAPRPDDAAAPASVEDAGGSPFAERAAAVAPPNATQWTLDGLALYAPAGKVFTHAIVKDFDGDGHRDAFAIVRAEGKPELAGEVVFFHGREGGTGPAESVAAPSELASDPAAARGDAGACGATQRLGLIGKHSVIAELGVLCAKPGAPSRWVGVLAGDKASKVKLAAVLYDPPAAPRLTVEADGSDQDADDIDDVGLRITLEGSALPFESGPPSKDKVSVILRWLDRPAGLSRDVAPTDASFAALGAAVMTRAVRTKEASSVPGYAAQIRALYRAICPEGGLLRMVRKVGAVAMACGPVRALEDAGLAEVRAYVTMGDPVRAINAFERSQKPPAPKTAARASEAQGWITQAWPVSTASGHRVAGAVPQVDQGKAPAWGALAFESSGKLLMKTAAGVVRFDPDQGDEGEAEGVTPWRSAVLSPDGAMRWIEAYNPCDGIALRATFAPTGDGKMRDVALPILASRCSGTRGEPARALPIAWGARGLEALVTGDPITISADLARAVSPEGKPAPADAPYVMGAPRSPNGKLSVVPTSLGLLVRGAKSRLYRAPELDGAYTQLRDCVVSDDGTRVACIRAARVWVGFWDAP